MNLQQANIILKKINRLYESMILDSKIDIHEQKLMLSYIQQLHTSFSDDELPVIPKKVTKTVTTPTPPAVTTITPPVVTPAPKVIKTVTPPPPPAEVKVTPPVVIVPPTPQPKVEQPVVAASTPTAPTPAPVKPAPKKVAIPEDVEILFAEDGNPKELSERLAAQPIRDLTKSIGINEKILTTNELFSKDSVSFNDALYKLNNFKNFEEATPFLAELATKYGWTKRNKKKKAQIFIKLIKRRYN